MSSLPEVYSEVNQHLDKPWYSMHEHAENILKADVKPLSGILIDELIGNLVSNDQNRRQLVSKLFAVNTSLLHRSDYIAIVLDGRSNGVDEGFLGDMIEASRLVNALRTNGKSITIITPHSDLFQGTTDPKINILPLPTNIWASHTAPWSQELLSYLHNQIGDIPCIFPMNANMPVLIQTNKEGSIINNDTLTLAKKVFRPDAKVMKITPDIWGKKGIHQLQALQIVANLFGLDEVRDWQQFPQAFLHPTLEAKEVASEVVKKYGCFDYGSRTKTCPPIYLHPGVATNGAKLTTKFYPEAKWVDVIKGLADSPHVNSLTLLEPTDPLQGAMTLRLAIAAVEADYMLQKYPYLMLKNNTNGL